MRVCPIHAQSNINPEKLTVDDGLSQGFITSIVQDREGFLWFGSSNGLNRYDGREIRVFANDPLNPYSITSNWISAIVDAGEYLLVGLRDGDVNAYDKSTQRFHLLKLLGRASIPIYRLDDFFWESCVIQSVAKNLRA